VAAALTGSGGGGGRPEAEPWLARMRLLGRFELVARDGRPGTPRSVKGRAILAYLALAPAGTADRGRLAGLVWGDSADAKASLRQCLRELRQTLAGAGLDPLLQTNPQEVVLDTRAVWIDALEMRRLLRAGGLDAAESIADLYAGDLLAEVAIREPTFEDWLTIEREALRARVCHALETRAGHCVDEGQLDLARRLAGALLAIDPAHEAAHRALMRVHAFAGDLPAAMRQYQTCREALARGLDLRPSADTEKLLQAIRSGSLGRQDQVSRPPVQGGKVAARGPPAHLSVAVMERPTATADPTDRAVLSALGSGLREALARKRWLSIADPESIRLTGLGRSAVPRVAPDYQVSISILRIGDRLRFTAQLLEGHSARIVWADHYDRRLVDEVFELVDGLAGTLARRLDWEVELAETVRVSQQPPELLSARDQAMRAIPLIFDLTPG
jgi:DNA-binding SARP family transcriptional activator